MSHTILADTGNNIFSILVVFRDLLEIFYKKSCGDELFEIVQYLRLTAIAITNHFIFQNTTYRKLEIQQILSYFVNLSTITRILSNLSDKGNSGINPRTLLQKVEREWEWVAIIQQEHDV
jgi:hypothetical protein